MSLRAKLARLTSAVPAPRADTDVRVAELRARLERLGRFHRAETPAPRPRTPAAAPGVAQPTPHGDVHVVETSLGREHHHGSAPLAGALRAAPNDVACVARDPRFAGLALEHALFVDTETTGLAGGTGTVPFLIG